MKTTFAALALAVSPVLAFAQGAQGIAADPAYVKQVEDWRKKAEEGLRRDNGWLTLAGRYPLKPGENRFGTAPTNDIVFPPGLGPAGMGSLYVEPGKVTLKLVPGLKGVNNGLELTEKEMGTNPENRDWVQVGRASFHIIERDGRYILRLADKESQVRKNFQGRVWYPVNDNYRVWATYKPYDPIHKVKIVNVIDEVSDEPVPGYVEFDVGGRAHRLDVIGDDSDGLFFVFRDPTAGDTTYGSGRFLHVSPKPKAGERFQMDLNRAYNPPCAFSEFTTCPLPPKQNILNVRIEAGEKYPPKRAG